MDQSLNDIIRKEVRKFLRLSCERDLYTIPQAAFRLNISRNEFNEVYVKSGKIKLVIINGAVKVPKEQIDQFIASEKKYIHKDARSAV